MTLRSIEAVRETVGGEIFSDAQLAAVFPDRRVREGRLQRMVQRGELLRMKRGFFAFSDTYRRAPISTFYAANILSGPSYVSLESALSWYGLIPETVYAMTSVSYSRSSSIETPLGLFTYRRIPESAFHLGVHITTGSGPDFLMGTQEKALLDKFYLDCKEGDLFDIATKSLRIEEEAIREIDLDMMLELGKAYENKRFLKRLSSFRQKALA
ncbi:hypothetical protein MRY87_11325 [bacterium]|nr:hypothetical protein [bacterium]